MSLWNRNFATCRNQFTLFDTILINRSRCDGQEKCLIVDTFPVVQGIRVLKDQVLVSPVQSDGDLEWIHAKSLMET